MQFIRTDGWEEAAEALAARLSQQLANRRVLWLFSGGSNITASVKAMDRVDASLSQNLSVMPVDERFGPPGHADSNWQQLMAAGFEPKQAKLLPVLQKDLDFEQNAAFYNRLAGQAFAANSVVIGQLGIGPDGHVAGILPDSPACAETEALVVHYDAPPLKRLTLTFTALRKINTAYALAYGESKATALSSLKNADLTLGQQPAQILKQLSETYVYNDELGEANA